MPVLKTSFTLRIPSERDAALREITTFPTPFGLRRHKKLTLGVTSALKHYQQTLERKVFYDLQNVRNFSEDVIIWGKSQREHDFYLQKALQRVREHGLIFNREKCLFNLKLHFEMVLSKDGISADETKIQAIKKLKKPGNITELRSFLGLAIYLGSFKSNFSNFVDPLGKVLRKGQNWKWSDQQNRVFKLLKESLEDTKAMTYWKQFRKTRLTIDASSFALEAILEQKLEHSDVYKVVAYASQSSTEIERPYLHTEREALAVAWGCEDFWLFFLE